MKPKLIHLGLSLLAAATALTDVAGKKSMLLGATASRNEASENP
jgi:hypothetical protein